MKIYFKEEQKFTQWWLWAILLGIGIVPLYGIYKQIILEEKFADKPISDTGLILTSLGVFCIILIFWFIRLKTEITQDEIKIYFSPLYRKQIKWNEIKSLEIVKYSFVGYGIRLWTPYGTVFNIKGNKGLAIELRNGNKFLIGTQKEKELHEIINSKSGQNDLGVIYNK